MGPVYPLPRFAGFINILYMFVHICVLFLCLYVDLLT